MNLFTHIRFLVSQIIFCVTGHSLWTVTKYDDVVEFLHRPVDSASLGVCRMLFGFVMLFDIPEERGGANLFDKWNNPKLCHFPILSHITAMDATKMGVVYGIMWLGALGIFLGFKFRWACSLFTASYWYIFLVDRSVWNNHSYLFGLCGSLLLFTSANRYCSLDSWMNREEANATVPFWNYFIIKFQFFVLYFLAGLKKTSTEWLSGYAMSNLSYHWIFAPFRYTLGVALTDLLIVHWFTCFFDLTIAIWLIVRPTRPLATIFCVAFHLMNSNLFSIGMFPWMCLTQLPLFFDRNWPKVWIKKITKYRIPSLVSTHDSKNRGQKNIHKEKRTRIYSAGITSKRMQTIMIMMYCATQLALPYSHFITKGYNTWTEGPYGYSWDMMIHAWDTVRVTVKVKDNFNNQEHFIDPKEFAQTDRWTKHADMAYQFVHCISDHLIKDFHTSNGAQKSSPLTSTNISIYLDVWCSLNGRFQQRIFDPDVDIIKAAWAPWTSTTWVLPLIPHLAEYRAEMQRIGETVHGASLFKDILFVADYPGLSVEHAVSEELENVTMTVLQGNVQLWQGTAKGLSMRKGSSSKIESGCVHEVRTFGTEPSALMYTFSNQTLNNVPLLQKHGSVTGSIQKIIITRARKYQQFIRNVIFSIAHELGF